jgi:hypothetical protein
MDCGAFCFDTIKEGILPIVITSFITPDDFHKDSLSYIDAYNLSLNKEPRYTDKEIRLSHNIEKMLIAGTLDFKKYFLDIDKIQKYPITFVIKSNDSIENIKHQIKQNALKLYPVKDILDRYLEQIDFFSNMNYYHLVWGNKEVVKVYRERTNNPISAAIEIVRAYQKGN